MADDIITMKPIITTHQQKIYYDEDFEKFQCEQCGVGFLKKLLLAKHVKDIHLEERRNDSSDKNCDQPQIQDQIKHIEYVQESVFESVVNIDISSQDEHTPKGEELNCVICQKKFKSDNRLKTHDLPYHMKKGIQNKYSCEYCT